MSDIEFLQESATKELVEFLMTDRDMSLADALSLLEGSLTFEKLMDETTGLYRESPAYIYGFLSEELDCDCRSL